MVVGDGPKEKQSLLLSPQLGMPVDSALAEALGQRQS